MDSPPEPKPKRLSPAARNILIPVIIVLALVALLWPAQRRARESARRAACLSNTKQLELGLMQYADDYDAVFPWRVGAADRTEAWRDLGLLFPDYVSESKPFYCPSSHDERRETERAFFAPMRDERKRGRTAVSPIPGGDSRVVVSYSYSYNAMGAAPEGAALAPQPWRADRSHDIRLLADKKAGQPMDPRFGHMGRDGRPQGRNVAYGDGHVKWKNGQGALDPDGSSDAIGAPDAADYTDWWSDPPYYGE